MRQLGEDEAIFISKLKTNGSNDQSFFTSDFSFRAKLCSFRKKL